MAAAASAACSLAFNLSDSTLDTFVVEPHTGPLPVLRESSYIAEGAVKRGDIEEVTPVSVGIMATPAGKLGAPSPFVDPSMYPGMIPPNVDLGIDT